LWARGRCCGDPAGVAKLVRSTIAVWRRLGRRDSRLVTIIPPDLKVVKADGSVSLPRERREHRTGEWAVFTFRGGQRCGVRPSACQRRPSTREALSTYPILLSEGEGIVIDEECQPIRVPGAYLSLVQVARPDHAARAQGTDHRGLDGHCLWCWLRTALYPKHEAPAVRRPTRAVG